MRVGVTGATGFIGSHIVAALIAAGHHPIAFVRNPDRLRAAEKQHGIGHIRSVPGDLAEIERDPAPLGRFLDQVDAVVHCAGLASVHGIDAALAESMNTINGTASCALLRAAADRGIDPVVHISSIAALFPSPNDVMTSDDPPSTADSVYAQTKAIAERCARTLQDNGHPVAIFYPGGVFGPNDPGTSDIIDGNALMLKTGSFMLPKGAGNPFIDVRDLASAIVRSLEPGRGPQRYMAGGRWCDWNDWVDAWRAASGRSIRIFEVPPAVVLGLGRALDAISARLPGFVAPIGAESAMFMADAKPTDDDRLHTELGVTYRPLQESVDDMYRWMRANGHC